MTPNQGSADAIEAELANAAAHLKTADRTRALADACGPAAYAIVGAAALATVARLAWLDRLAWLILGAGVVTAVIVIAVRWVQASRRSDDWSNVAQRLDGGNDAHNRIATAYELAQARPNGPFERQAVQDGLAALRSAVTDRMIVDPPHWPVARLIAAGAATVMLLLVLFAAPRDGTANRPAGVVDAHAQMRTTFAIDAERTPPVSTTRPHAVHGESRKGSPGVPAATQPESPQRPNLAGKQARPSPDGSGGSMPSAGVATGGNGSARMSPASPAVAATPTPGAASAESARDTKSMPAADAGPAGGASPPSGSGGQSGDNSRATAAKSDGNDPSASVSAAASKEEVAAGGAPDDHPSSPPQGSGAPLRQDRGGQASRELGQSGNTGDSGNGRGGPSAAKKARGTSAIFLSVPLPDIVPGQLASGPSRMSSQQIPPRAGDLTPPPVVPQTVGNGDEAAVDRFTVPRESSAAVQAYLKRLRAEPPSPSEGASPK